MKIPYHQESSAVESQAAAWLARCDGGMSAEQAIEFARWCGVDPRHAAAVAEMEGIWTAMNRPRKFGQVESLRAELRALEARDRRRWTYASLAAAAVVSLVFYVAMPRVPSTDATGPVPATTVAHLLAPESRTLPDGSVVQLKTGAEITVAFTEARRVVVLKQGEAHFEVSKNPQRPFIVEAGAVKVRAVGTAFAVQMEGTEVGVLVTEGRVRVAPPPSATAPAVDLETGLDQVPLVEAGQQTNVSLLPSATATPVVVVTLSREQMAERLSWRVPRLEFTETTLGEAITLFNRHAKTTLRTADADIAAKRITGVFRSDNPEGFVRAVEMSLDLRAEYRANEILLHRAK